MSRGLLAWGASGSDSVISLAADRPPSAQELLAALYIEHLHEPRDLLVQNMRSSAQANLGQISRQLEGAGQGAVREV